jgi:hypothetical protein
MRLVSGGWAFLLLLACRQAPASPAATATSPPAAATKEARDVRCLEAARACGVAFVAQNFERLFDCMPKEAFDAFPDAGGRAGLRAQILDGLAEMAGDGVFIESADYEAPRTFVDGGTRLFAIVPERLRMKVPDGHLLQRGYMVAVSEDGGESWKFVSGTVKRKDLLRLFPDFPATLTLPDIPRPELAP